jgi:hypothetical protein
MDFAEIVGDAWVAIAKIEATSFTVEATRCFENSSFLQLD